MRTTVRDTVASPLRRLKTSATSLTRAPIGAYLELTKPRLTLLAAISSLVGYYLGNLGPPDVLVLLGTLLGASLIGGGANALNQYLERDVDVQMTRTANRPLPSGRLEPAPCLYFGVVACFAGLVTLAITTNQLTTGIALLIVVTYDLIYTPLKRISPINTVVGAISGALPILMGWSASGRPLTWGAWSLFAIVFLWQLPHTFAICCFHRGDYQRAGFRLWPLRDETGKSTGWQTVLMCALLVPLTLAPTALGLTGRTYGISALAVGVVFVAVAAQMLLRPSPRSARLTFVASISYLPALMLLMMLDKTD